MYSEAHLVAGGDAAADRDLADDALWLARVIAAALPREAEAQGLLALLRVPSRARVRARRRRRARAARASRTGRDGMPRSSPMRGRRSSAPRCCAGRAAGSCTRRSRRATRMPRPSDDDRLAAGADALRHAARVRPVAGRAAQPRGGARRGSRARRRRSPRWTRSRTRSPATTCGTPCGRTCCASSAATTRRSPADLRALELTANDAERRLIAARLAR